MSLRIAAALLTCATLAGPAAHAAEAEPATIVPPALVRPLDVPAVAARRDLPATVVVDVTIGVDGAPSDARVFTSPGAPWSDAALAAVTGARFVPATRGGQPIAARIRLPVTFSAPAAVSGFERREPEPTPAIPEGVSGRVLERGTRRPVAGLAVRLTDPRGRAQPLEVLTDEDGAFAFPDLPRGAFTVEVPLAIDDDDARRTVDVPARVTLRITPDATSAYRTRVTNDAGTSSAARVRVPVERAREVPGSSGDPLKVLESLPGVARPAAAGPGAGELSVRGSAPEDTQITIDGLPLIQLYHFGNIYSVLQDEWIGDIDFRAGGYSTDQGNGTGGLVDVTLRDLPTDGAHGHLDVNVYHAAGLVTVPVSDTWTIGAAVRRSWVDAILGSVVGDGVDFGTVPRYYDYQLRADHRPDADTRLRLLVFGSDDEVVVLGGAPDADDPDGSGFALERSFHQIQGTLTFPLHERVGMRLGVATSYQQLRVSPGANDFRLTFDPITARADLDWRPSTTVRVRGGLLAEVLRFKVDVAVPRPTKEGQVQLPSEIQEVVVATEEGFGGRLDLWTEASVRPLSELTLLGGLRLGTWHGNFQAVAPDARLAIGWDVSETIELTLTGGLNHQAPAPDETATSIGNPDLSPERAAYINLGLEQRVGEVLSVELQGFVKWLDDLVVPTETYGGLPYDNAGTGTIFGGELLVRLQHPIVDAWVAYTLSRSRRVDRPGQPERFFSFDQTHVLALVAGVQLGDGWRFGTRLRYATGNPFTPLEPAYYDAGADVWVPRAAAAPLSERTAGFFQLDLRVDKTFVFDDWRLDLYLELNNATNRRNIESVQYASDYQSRDDIESLPLTPSLGIRGSF
ncbi:MAG: TonB-dependent receptor [Deltaproteobacteria bacterium]|nr:TonB-dependent receptor [Deltaproteobacteria bacterium]